MNSHIQNFKKTEIVAMGDIILNYLVAPSHKDSV